MVLLQVLLLSLLFLASLLTLYSKKRPLWRTQKPSATPPKSPASNKCSSTKTIRIDDDKGQEIKNVFRTFDKNKDGYITRQELGESLKKMGISTGEEEVTQMLERLDSNGDGLIDLDEFYGVFEQFSSQQDREEGDGDGDDDDREVDLKEAFDVFDKDRDGLITVEELGMVLSALGLNEGKRVEACKEMIRKVDVDGDGMVNFDEFRRMMKASNGGVARLISAF